MNFDFQLILNRSIGLCLTILVRLFLLSVFTLVTPQLVRLAAAEPKGKDNCPDARPLTFPRDHGAHRCFQTEWWYYTGHLVEENNGDKLGGPNIFSKPSDFGFQFTIFRKSDGHGSSDKYLAHGALSTLSKEDSDEVHADSNGQASPKLARFTFAQVVGDEAVGLAGASNLRLEVWVQDWKAQQVADRHVIEYELKDGTKIRLIAEESYPPILNGDSGKSRKADCEQCFSFYYSIPHLKLSGEIIKGDKIKRVHGIAWMDHEFMSGAMEQGTIGWDWFSLYWPDGASLMVFQLRRKGKESYLAGTHMSSNGQVTKLSGGDIALIPIDQWRSRGGVSYPTKWQLKVNKLNLESEVSAIIKEQVIEPERLKATNTPDKADHLPSEYWEGAVEDKKQNIKGYLEMTGYERPIGALL